MASLSINKIQGSRKIRHLITTIVILFLCSILAFGDTVCLNNGDEEERDSSSKPEKLIRIKPDTEIVGIEREDMLTIDYEKLLIQELIITKQEDEQREALLQQDSEYQLWKERMERAKKKRKKGLTFIITGAGAAAVGGALVLSSRTSGPEIPGPYYFPSEFGRYLSVKQRHYYEWKWYSAALLAGGGALAVWGLFIYDSGDKMKKGLEEEGKSKGYLTLNLNPQLNQVNIAYKIEF